jgi:diguanylate cyclase (GGDEF)-like protein
MIVVALAAAGAAILALLVAVAVLWRTVRRLRTAADERVTDAVGALNQRMETMVEELQDALARAHEEARRNRFLGELAGSIDLDEITDRVLQAASGVHGADAALLSLEDAAGGASLSATLGLPAVEAERHLIVGPPDGRDVRSVSVGYRYPDSELAKDEPLIHGGVAVPVAGESERLGMLAVYTHAAATPLADDAVEELEQLARRAGPALENARRFREARQLADHDALTGLHNRRYFHETLARECARAHRYDRRLALIVFDVDDFKAVNDRIGHLAGDAVLAEVADRVRTVVRSADVPCRIGGDEFAVIMPESAVDDARGLSQRLQATVSANPIVHAGRLEISAGVAELMPADDAAGFFERADEALYRAKEAGKGRVVTASAVQNAG